MDDSTGMARLTFLIAPQEKRAFDELCASQDLTSSQVMRRLIASYLEQHRPDRPGGPPAPAGVAQR